MVEEEKAVLQAQLSLEDDAQGCFIQSALCLLKVATASVHRTLCGKKILRLRKMEPSFSLFE